MAHPASKEPDSAQGRSLWQSDILPTLSLGMPLAGAQLAQMAINTTDVLMIGRLGAVELAASVLAFNFYMLLWFFGMGILQAVIPFAARALGQRKPRELRRAVRMGFWVAVLFCIPVWLVLFFIESILLLMGQKQELAELAGTYMRVLQWTMLPALLIMAIRGFLTVMERTQVVLWATIAGAIINAILDYLLIFGEFGFPRLELVGAGIASVFSATTTFLFLLVYSLWHPRLRRYNLLGRIWRSDWPVFFQIVRMGAPIGLTIVAEGSLFTASAIMIGWLGTIPLAAHGIALQIASITFMVPVGLSMAAMTRVSLAAGRDDHQGIGRAGWTSLGVTMIFMGIFAVLFWTIPEKLVGLYLDLDDPQAMEVLTYGVSFLLVAALFQLADGAQIIGVNNLRGLGDTTIPLLYALFGYWVVGISLSLGLGFLAGWGGVGVWVGLAGGLASVALLANYRFAHREKLGLVKG
ncbi:MATE family multidrug resistance protein [Labrenzia sp. EL_13]|uniref:MATE family efflux transporter n=1 Tax=Roseibium album TaxID=311410 RepID=UPI0018C9351A|nr:MATE family efflux transporter [Roseibium album]MBG6164257.1 MATE family multidrug resistance protein [Labrenzia sp. EL_195]MBG6204463.1 MATE family multidrug resistance protein [Labrenzia sp. EL_13]MBG6208706.1 MATE family multidrug resistance protein [Labrenzia sp. EL_126]MCR9059407.1 MATE family efflux transporter [Paracoccaceae bacterium]